MEIVLSGIRPTGKLHLGNYFGALRNFVHLQNEYDCYFFIADYHSLTTHPTPHNLFGNVREVLVRHFSSRFRSRKSNFIYSKRCSTSDRIVSFLEHECLHR